VPKIVEQINDYLFIDTHKTNNVTVDMKKYIVFFPKLTRISKTGWNKRRVIGSFSFYDGSMIMMSGRAHVLRSSE